MGLNHLLVIFRNPTTHLSVMNVRILKEKKMGKKKEIIEVIIALLVVASMAYGATKYFASAEDLFFVETSHRLHLTSHAINEIQARVWRLEEKHGSDNCHTWQNKEDREEYKKLKLKLEKLKKQEEYLIQRSTKQGG